MHGSTSKLSSQKRDDRATPGFHRTENGHRSERTLSIATQVLLQPPNPPSFDHLIGQQKQSRRHFESEALRCLEVDREPKFDWLLNR
jgi:hypothetical protein